MTPTEAAAEYTRLIGIGWLSEAERFMREYELNIVETEAEWGEFLALIALAI